MRIAPSLICFSPFVVSIPKAVNFFYVLSITSRYISFVFDMRAALASLLSPFSPSSLPPPLTTTHLYSDYWLAVRVSLARAMRVSTQTRIREDHPRSREECAALRGAMRGVTVRDATASWRWSMLCGSLSSTAHYETTECFLR